MNSTHDLGRPTVVSQSSRLADVRYDIRGPVLRRARELEAQGHEIIKLNIGNPAPFGLFTPDAVLSRVTASIADSQGYSDARGIAPAREAVARYFGARLGVTGVTPDDVYLGNGVSELIVMALQALLNPGDEVLVPSPDYPLWTGAVNLGGGRAVHYRCAEDLDWNPDVEGFLDRGPAHPVAVSPLVRNAVGQGGIQLAALEIAKAIATGFRTE